MQKSMSEAVTLGDLFAVASSEQDVLFTVVKDTLIWSEENLDVIKQSSEFDIYKDCYVDCWRVICTELCSMEMCIELK